MWFGDNADDALRFIAGLGAFAALLRDLDTGVHAAAVDQLRASIDAHHTGDDPLNLVSTPPPCGSSRQRAGRQPW